MSPRSVYLLWHSHAFPDGEIDDKLLGVYSSRERAMNRQPEAAKSPGFRDEPEGFTVSEYQLDDDHWTEGYVTEWKAESLGEEETKPTRTRQPALDAIRLRQAEAVAQPFPTGRRDPDRAREPGPLQPAEVEEMPR
jgi:hypothetical protein